MVRGAPPPAALHYPAHLVASLEPLGLWLPQHVALRPRLAPAARLTICEVLMTDSDDFWRWRGSVGGC